MSAELRVLLLDDGVGQEDVSALAAGSGWPLTTDLPREFELNRALGWDLPAGGRLELLEMHDMGYRALAITPADHPAGETVAAAVAVLDVADLLAAATSPDPVLACRGLFGLAASLYPHQVRPAPDLRYERVIKQALERPEAPVRYVAQRVLDDLQDTARDGTVPGLTGS